MSRVLDMALHLTPANNLVSIAANGLLPSIGPLSKLAGETTPRVYLFPSANEADVALHNWLGELFDETDTRVALLLVDVTGLSLDAGSSFEIATRFQIHPSRIEIACQDVDALNDVHSGIDQALNAIDSTMQYHCLNLDEWRAIDLLQREAMKRDVDAIARTYRDGKRRDLAVHPGLFG